MIFLNCSVPLFWLTGDFWGSCWDRSEEKYCYWWPYCSRWPLPPNRFELHVKMDANCVCGYLPWTVNAVCWAGFCDFEMDFCGWVNSHSQFGVDWDWLSGYSQGQFVPNWDHSTNTALGMSSLCTLFMLKFQYHSVSRFIVVPFL